MTTQTNSITKPNFIQRIRLAWSRLLANIKKRKKNPDWARVEEPDTFLKGFYLAMLTLVFTGLVGELIYYMVAGQNDIIYWIASALVDASNGAPFEQVYAGFGLAVLALINLTLLVIVLVFGHADQDDVVEMLSDLDSNIHEHLSEMDHELTERLDTISRNV